jgi:hypothetical protein
MAAKKVLVTFGRDVTNEDVASLQASEDVLEALLIDDVHINVNINTDPGEGGFPDRLPA